MNRFGAWLFNFMRGRYGLDELGRHLGILFVVLIIVSVVIGVVAQLVFDIARMAMLATLLSLAASIVNWASVIVLVWAGYRFLSRNLEKRRAENARYLARKAKRRGKRGGKDARGSAPGDDMSRDALGFEYLTCPFCGQRMRVPRGKGKLAVKCPSCGEKTIVNS